jgi:glycosyltransferase involved in cell wall biosynthesis
VDVSIIIPCYNQGQYLDDALHSIAAVNTPHSLEIIIVDDGSTDEETIKKLGELTIKGYSVIRQQNRGLGAARNTAIKAATGTYIIPLDCDNKIHENYLTTAIDILNTGEYDVVYGDKEYFGNQQKRIAVGAFNLDRLLRANYIDACAVYRRSVWLKVGGYDENMPAMGNEDWDLWIAASLAGSRFYYLPKVCFYYRITSQSMRLNVTNPAFEANKKYIIQKHAEYFYSFYHSNYRKLTYLKNHRIKAGINLLLGRLGK